MKMSLKGKISILIATVALILLMLTVASMYGQGVVARSYRTVSYNQLPKIEMVSDLIAKFRMIRIQVRSLGLVGNTDQDREFFKKETLASIDSFLRSFEEFKKMDLSERELEMSKDLQKYWDDFYAFGVELISKYDNPTSESLLEGSEMIRVTCPVLSGRWVATAEKYLEYESQSTNRLVQDTSELEERIYYYTVIASILTFLASLSVGIFYSNILSKNIESIVELLYGNAKEVSSSSEELSSMSSDLSSAAHRSASSLQQTVSAIDQISAMIERNAQSAGSSSQVSSQSSHAALRGQKVVEEMILSIDGIAQSNESIVLQMQANNKEFNNVIHVITQIGENTKVINDIVFQTKLLSFNASVEAARAGQHGKGFAVVAEEVGNLATMSGKAALEISRQLQESIDQVSHLARETNSRVEALIAESTKKIADGSKNARNCGEVFDEIIKNISTVNTLVVEVASASQEQSSGVSEVSKSMQQLDADTQQNTSTSQKTSQLSLALKDQASELNLAVNRLKALVTGSSQDEASKNEKHSSKIAV